MWFFKRLYIIDLAPKLGVGYKRILDFKVSTVNSYRSLVLFWSKHFLSGYCLGNHEKLFQATDSPNCSSGSWTKTNLNAVFLLVLCSDCCIWTLHISYLHGPVEQGSCLKTMPTKIMYLDYVDAFTQLLHCDTVNS